MEAFFFLVVFFLAGFLVVFFLAGFLVVFFFLVVLSIEKRGGLEKN